MAEKGWLVAVAKVLVAEVAEELGEGRRVRGPAWGGGNAATRRRRRPERERNGSGGDRGGMARPARASTLALVLALTLALVIALTLALTCTGVDLSPTNGITIWSEPT